MRGTLKKLAAHDTRKIIGDSMEEASSQEGEEEVHDRDPGVWPFTR